MSKLGNKGSLKPLFDQNNPAQLRPRVKSHVQHVNRPEAWNKPATQGDEGPGEKVDLKR